jgi:hypothetical protein
MTPSVATSAWAESPRSLAEPIDRGGQTRPLVDDFQPDARGLAPQPHHYGPSPVLDRVGQEIADGLGEAQPLPDYEQLVAGPDQLEIHAASGGGGVPRLDGVSDQLAEVERLGAPVPTAAGAAKAGNPSGSQVLESDGGPAELELDRPEPVPGQLPEPGRELERKPDRRQRPTQLVAGARHGLEVTAEPDVRDCRCAQPGPREQPTDEPERGAHDRPTLPSTSR